MGIFILTVILFGTSSGYPVTTSFTQEYFSKENCELAKTKAREEVASPLRIVLATCTAK